MLKMKPSVVLLFFALFFNPANSTPDPGLTEQEETLLDYKAVLLCLEKGGTATECGAMSVLSPGVGFEFTASYAYGSLPRL